MPGTPRKTAAKKAAPRPAPKAPEPAGNPNAIDLLTVLGTQAQEPVPVTLLGVDADVRREFLGEEVVLFSALLRENKTFDAVKMLCASNGDELAEKIGSLSVEAAIKVVNYLAKLSTITEGEPLALFPAS